MSLSYQIKAYLNREIDFLSEVLLHDDGDGAYIKEWNVDEPEPTQEQLDAVSTEADALEALAIVLNNRVTAYPSSGDQFDQIYHEGIDAWKETIQAVKDAHPKPE